MPSQLTNADIQARRQAPSKIPRPIGHHHPISARTARKSKLHITTTGSPMRVPTSSPRHHITHRTPAHQQQQPTTHHHVASEVANKPTEGIHAAPSRSEVLGVGGVSSPGTLNGYAIPPRISSRTAASKPLKHWETDAETGVKSRRLPCGGMLRVEGDAERVLLGEEDGLRGGVGAKVVRGLMGVTKRISKSVLRW
jgi:hypothetical protein